MQWTQRANKQQWQQPNRLTMVTAFTIHTERDAQ